MISVRPLRLIRVLVALSGLAGLAACTSAPSDVGAGQDNLSAPPSIVATSPTSQPDPSPSPAKDTPAAEAAVPAERAAQPIVLTFAFNKAEITASTMQRLWNAAPALKAAKPDEIRIYGYTDSRGPKGYNKALSERRARAVAKQLAKLGVTAPTIEIVGKGSGAPAAKAPSPQADQDERRVEITWGPVDSAALSPSSLVDTALVTTGLTSTQPDTSLPASVKAGDPRLNLAHCNGLGTTAGFGIQSPGAIVGDVDDGGHGGLVQRTAQDFVVKPHHVALIFPSHRPRPSALSQSKAGPSRPHPTSGRIMPMDHGDKAVGSMTFLWQNTPLARSQTIQAPVPHRPADQPQGRETNSGGHPAHLPVSALA